jgi:hypothetical protein
LAFDCATPRLSLPTTCFSQGLQSNTSLSFSLPLISSSGSALMVPSFYNHFADK